MSKILLFDIETSPNISYTWGKWEQNVIEFMKEWDILSFSAKWLDGSKQITMGRCDYKDKTDKAIVTHLWNLFNEADIIVAHNGDAFDIKKVQQRFSFYKMNPPSPFKTIDTKKVAKKYFSFNSNSLNDLGVTLGLGKKEKHDGFETWLGCMAGDKKAWKTMKKYNAKDVILLEKVYLHFLPWISNHPNISSGVQCPKCKGKHIQWRGTARTLSGEYARFQCQDCGGWGRSKDKLVNTNIKLINI